MWHIYLAFLPLALTMRYDRVITTPWQTLVRTRRIVGGYAATIEHAPYLVSLRKYGEFKCGGSLITQRCILTAAHCVGGKSSDQHTYTIHAGNTYLLEQRNRRQVAEIYVAPGYTNKTLDSDMAIVRLDAMLPLRSQFIETIALAAEKPTRHAAVQISGWGFVSDRAENPAMQLRMAVVRVIDHAVCGTLYADYRNVTERMFCAAVPGQVDACFADSGGPAVINGELAGVVSWGRGQRCAEVNAPGVYADVASLRQWIEQVIAKHCM